MCFWVILDSMTAVSVVFDPLPASPKGPCNVAKKDFDTARQGVGQIEVRPGTRATPLIAKRHLAPPGKGIGKAAARGREAKNAFDTARWGRETLCCKKGPLTLPGKGS